MDEQWKLWGLVAAGIGVVGLTISFLTSSADGPFDPTSGTVLACYSEFVALGEGRVRRVDWVEFVGTVEGRLEPMVEQGMPDASKTTLKAAQLLVQIASTHPIREADKVKQCADELVPLIEEIRG